MTMSLVLQSLDVLGVTEGAAVVIIGLLALLLWAVVEFRNPAGIVMWGLSTLSLVAVVVFGIGTELFWLAVMLTVILTIVGVTARVAR